MEGRWEDIQFHSCRNTVKSIIDGNHSILGLSKVHHPAAASPCIRRVCGFNSRQPIMIGGCKDNTNKNRKL
ncbi:hypothetical protein DBZ47_09890 [Escherichia coli]|nr:hypothetical protein DBZ47_09890 [Escherichia coli]PUD94205.1 hypothetical protein DBX29_07530 [Escherichia coli]